jgi:Lrp/AsnC family transcriptional regulator, leucine-responsive regulatory protein
MRSEHPGLDGVDLTLLAMLQENGRISQHELARAVGLSAPAVADRVRKLEERGVIVGYAALLDARRLGRDVTAFIAVGIAGSKHFAPFVTRVEEHPAILECHAVTGEGSHLLKVRVESTAALELLLAEVQSWPGVQWTTTSVVLSTVKEGLAVPLPGAVAEAAQGSQGHGPDAATQMLHVPFRHHT